jgi:NAD(P)-dependent dehydrogenase (short-subunit alcohol dehydrogenase family)
MKNSNEIFTMRDRRVLITGGAGHLGYGIASALSGLGAHLIIIDRPEANFDAIERLENEHHVSIKVIRCDLEDHLEREEVIKQVIADGSGINCLINNAAFVGTDALEGWNVDFGSQSIETWRRALEVNLTAPFHLSQGLSSVLRGSVGASIINIGSIYAEYAPDWKLYEGLNMGNPAAYGCSKAGLLQLTRWLATTLAPDIRVNAISPGGLLRDQSIEFIKRYQEKTPLKRMGTVADIVGGVIFLASDMAGYVTGQTLSINGGWGIS